MIRSVLYNLIILVATYATFATFVAKKALLSSLKLKIIVYTYT